MSILRNKTDVEGEMMGAEAWAPIWEGATPDQFRFGPVD